MTITATLTTALSGLTANARAAEVVSSNIANALTPGYGRREIVTTPLQSGGVGVTGVYRHADAGLIGDRRAADAASGGQAVLAEFLSRTERVLGTPGEVASLDGRIAAFDTALIDATSRPESEARLSGLADAARALTTHLADVSTDIQAARTTADDRIAADVVRLNAGLTRVGELNALIRTTTGAGRDASALIDQRQQVIDSVAAIVPLREVARDNGQIALMTATGAVLVDGQVAQFGFAAAGQVTYAMSQATGGLSGLTLNGRPVATAGGDGPIAGGTLAAQFAVRDSVAPQAQARIDALARDVIDRFAAPGLDATRPAGAPGLFTDAGAAFDPVNEAGLSQRLRLNAAVDPAQGGALWRLRDGLGATEPGPVGNTQLLTDWQAALTRVQDPASAAVPPGQRSLAGFAADVLSRIASDRLSADGEASYAASRADTLRSLELAGGVDSDREIQTLLLIEQNYAANAKVVQAADQMIQLLLEM